jgi:hypothetical protein
LIKIFGKIRQRLLTENKFSKYLLYAIGEIILVVIGILIALQINKWNDKKIERNREADFIEKLKNQLENNIENLNENIEEYTFTYENSNNYIPIIGDSITENVNQKLDSLVLLNSYDFHTNINMNTIIEAQQNGDLNLVSSDSLRQFVYDIIKTNTIVQERNRIANTHLNNEFTPYLTKNFNIRSLVNTAFPNDSIGKSMIYKNDNINNLYKQEFENLIFTRLNYNLEIIYNHKELMDIIEKTYQLIK